MKRRHLSLPCLLLLGLVALGAAAQEAPATRAPAEDTGSAGASSGDTLQSS